MITIDGSKGEGGGQIVRSALALSLVTGTPFRLVRVRAGREKPGLRQQHLTAVQAAAAIGGATVEGAEVGAREFTFHPGPVRPGQYRFDIGTAGSTNLVLQTVLPPLMLAEGPSQLTLTGGTHNAHAPPFEFLRDTFLPLVARMGPQCDLRLLRYGFYPPGGGELHLDLQPSSSLRPLHLPQRADIRARKARALVVRLPETIARRELQVIVRLLGLAPGETEILSSEQALSPGNVVLLQFVSDALTETFTALGERGVRAETVAERVCEEAQGYLQTGAPVGEHLADQLLIPLALAGAGSFFTGPLSLHSTTNMDVIQSFLPVVFDVQPEGDRVRVSVTRA